MQLHTQRQGCTKLGPSLTVRNRWRSLAIGHSLMLAGHLFRERIGSMAGSSLQFSTKATSMTCSCSASLLQRRGVPSPPARSAGNCCAHDTLHVRNQKRQR